MMSTENRLATLAAGTLVFVLGGATSCQAPATPIHDGGPTRPTQIAFVDAGGMADAGWEDAGAMDASSQDAGESDSGVDAGMYGGDTDAGIPDAGPGCNTGTSCNQATQLGSLVPEVAVERNPPSAFGGTITPGTYVLTAVTVYTGTGSGLSGTLGSIAETAVVSAVQDGFEVQQVSDNNGCVQWATADLLIDGTAASLNQTCPSMCLTDQCSYAGEYTSDGTTITLYVPEGIGTAALVLSSAQ
jgi:hypothetical protein